MRRHSIENTPNIRSLAKFHFIAGLPRSGVSLLTALLNQNPRFMAGDNDTAEVTLTKIVESLADSRSGLELLDQAQKIALLRGVLDAVYHDRPLGSVVFDANRNWLAHTDQLVALFPLARFIICVRNPASIVNSIELSGPLNGDEQSLAKSATKLMGIKGEIGREIDQLRMALSGQHTERMFVLDYDRLTDDPEEVMDALYDFLREPEFAHDFENLGGRTAGLSGPVHRAQRPLVLPTRLILQLSGAAFWRNLKRTSATMMLGRAR
ncbi:MAG: sulfotransferase [Alphaproteobacteria bacterium]|nr:sulfotransferase [Alphaproteobacteria bacterium]